MKMNYEYREWEVLYSFTLKFTPEDLEFKIRSSIFMIIGASAGLPALVWSIGELIEHRKNGHRISVFIILLLLLTDFTELYLSPYILIKSFFHEYLCYKDWTCSTLWSLWSSLRVCGLLLNQLVALEGILSVRYPLYTAAVFSSRCFRLFYILVLLGLIITGVLHMNTIYHYVFLLSTFIVSVITCLVSCGALCSAERRSHTSRKTDRHILVIFIVSLLVFYVYLIVLVFPYILHSYVLNTVYTFSWYLVRLRLISDPLLCVLVCRQNLRVQTSQNPEETSLSRSARM